MNQLAIFTRFPDQKACIEHLENVRWGDNPNCPHCGNGNVAHKGDGHRVGRWNCHACKSSFNVLSGTIFEKTKVPLQKWFMAIDLIINAKKTLSSCQLARDLELNQKSAWYMQQRIRAQMATEQGIVEADNHSENPADGETHTANTSNIEGTNSIEGFWPLLKRAWHESHQHSRRPSGYPSQDHDKKHYTPLHAAETCWKYNQRNNDNAFGTFIRGCFA